MIDKDKLKYVITTIVQDDYNYPLAWKILDYFEKKADSVADYDALGEISITAKYDELRLRAAKYTYTHAKTSDELFSARENLYNIYNTLNEPEKALFYIELNLKTKPNDANTVLNKAFNLSLLGQKEEAESIIESVIPQNKKMAENIEYALSGKQLREGKTALGIKNFITKFKPKNTLFEEQLKLKFWDGGIYPGKTIVINGEGGIGDEIINIRFFDWFKKMGMRPILYSSWARFRPDIVSLFRRHGYEVETRTNFFRKDWLWTHMMALPGYMGLAEDQLWTGPYLHPLRQSKNQLRCSNFKIGIKCSGNPYFEQDVYRKIPVDKMLEIMPKNAKIYYIDRQPSNSICIDLNDSINTWEDTLDYIDQMDLIVSSCTSLAHAAGAMGKRTIVIVPIAEYYVWTSTRNNETTPWYGDNLTVLKQTEVRSWDKPLSRAKEIIQQLSDNHSSTVVNLPPK
jgi:tetratricopeptide (TPR) repeat protein